MASPLARPLPWDLVSAAYADEVVPLFTPFARAALDLAALAPDARIADVACGPGTLALLAAPGVARVSALDFSPQMIAHLRSRAANHTNVEAQVGDGQALPWNDGSFDAAFSLFGLMFFPDRAAGFAELHRVLVPGGRAVVSSWHPPSAVPALMMMYGALAEAQGAPPQPPGTLPLVSAEDYEREMAAAGFDDIRVHTVSTTLETTSTAELWQGFARTSAPIVLTRQRYDDEAWADLSARVLARLEAELGTGPQRVDMPAHLAVGTRVTRRP